MVDFFMQQVLKSDEISLMCYLINTSKSNNLVFLKSNSTLSTLAVADAKGHQQTKQHR
jgi:hypothetical protein